MLINQIINKSLKKDFKCLKKIQYQSEFGRELMPGKVDIKMLRIENTLVLNTALNK